MKWTKLVKSAKAEGTRVEFDSITANIELVLSPYDNNITLRCTSGGNALDRYHKESDKEGQERYDELIENTKTILPELEKICSEFDTKVIALMKQHGFVQE